jgi:hypothetical protein
MLPSTLEDPPGGAGSSNSTDRMGTRGLSLVLVRIIGGARQLNPRMEGQ